MSQEGALALAERIKTDQEFSQSLMGASDDEARRQIVSDAGYDVTGEDKETLKEALGGNGELSDEELEGVSGGSIIYVIWSMFD